MPSLSPFELNSRKMNYCICIVSTADFAVTTLPYGCHHSGLFCRRWNSHRRNFHTVKNAGLNLTCWSTLII